MKVEESRKEMEDWFKELLSYVRGKIWNTGGIWVCESHPLMPHEQGLSFDCKCGGGVGMPPIRIKGHRGIPIRHGKMPVIPDDCPVPQCDRHQ